VNATGVTASEHSGNPACRFCGTRLHSSQYTRRDDFAESARSSSAPHSGHDIAQDLCSSGASVTLVQRSSTLVVNIEPSGSSPIRSTTKGRARRLRPDRDSMPSLVRKATPRSPQRAARSTSLCRRLDAARVFKLDFGEDGIGLQFKYLTRGGGYYFNVGCSDMIVDGKVALAQFSDVDRFVAEGARMRNGETLSADLVVLATGTGAGGAGRKLSARTWRSALGDLGLRRRRRVAQHVRRDAAAGYGSSAQPGACAGFIRTYLACRSGARGGLLAR